MVTLRGRFGACPWFPVGGKPALARAVPRSSFHPASALPELQTCAGNRPGPQQRLLVADPERIVRTEMDGPPTRSAALRAEG
jgi:hypothetical protein